jgi:hypothetical protein
MLKTEMKISRSIPVTGIRYCDIALAGNGPIGVLTSQSGQSIAGTTARDLMDYLATITNLTHKDFISA